MESKIIQEKQNPFLHRQEYVVEIQSNNPPTFEDVKKVVGKDADLSVVKKIHTNFGRNTFTADVFVYDNKEKMKEIEPKKKKEEEQSTPVSAPPPAPAEQSKEEKKEEPKAEEKPAEEVKVEA